MLGFLRSTYGRGAGPILLDDVHCAGTETSLQQCTAHDIGDHSCDHTEDAGVRCMCVHVQLLTEAAGVSRKIDQGVLNYRVCIQHAKF